MTTTSGGTPHVRRTPTVSSYAGAKTRVRAPAAQLLERPRLLELLDQWADVPVILVVAPAGSGKTSLAASWLARGTGNVAWLALESADSDVTTFWAGVVAALDRSMPGRGKEARRRLKRPHGGADAVPALLSMFEGTAQQPVRLVIDDLHRVDDNPAIIASLEALIENLPAQLQLVLVSRRVPDLPIERLQAGGELAQVRFSQLRFSQAESVEMLSRLAPSMSDEEVSSAAASADGWAAALQLSALAAKGVNAQPVSSSPWVERDRFVDDYVWRELLEAEDPAVIDTLVSTSVAERVNPSLAEALTGRADAAHDLIEAEGRGLFVTRLDAHSWYEVHSLVRQMLYNELARRPVDALVVQHARAAVWFEEAGEVAPALEHWIGAGRQREALRLLASSTAELYDTGREETIVRTIGKISMAAAADDVDAMMDYAWCHLLVNVEGFFEAVKQTSAGARSRELDPTQRARLSTLEAIAQTVTGDWTGGREQAAKALDGSDARLRTDPIGRFAWNMVARGIALSESWDDLGADVADVRRALVLDPERQVAHEGTRALGLALAGHPIDAVRVAAGVRRVADVGNMTILRAEVAVAEALARRELGDAPAEQELDRLTLADPGPVTYARVLAWMALVEQYVGRGDVDRARAGFAEMETRVLLELPGRDARSWLGRLGTRVCLAERDVATALRWADQIDDPFWGPFSLARVRLASGDRAGAAEQLASADPRCVRHRVLRDLLQARTDPSPDGAAKALASAAEAAAASGIVQSVADEGPEVIELLERAAWTAPQAWLDRLRRLSAPALQLPKGSGALADELTDREREVLQLLPSRLTLREIAAELHVSLNTLKFHLRIIYRKLGVNSRSDAVEAARELRRAGRPRRHGGGDSLAR